MLCYLLKIVVIGNLAKRLPTKRRYQKGEQQDRYKLGHFEKKITLWAEKSVSEITKKVSTKAEINFVSWLQLKNQISHSNIFYLPLWLRS